MEALKGRGLGWVENGVVGAVAWLSAARKGRIPGQATEFPVQAQWKIQSQRTMVTDVCLIIAAVAVDGNLPSHWDCIHGDA
jgi:hypothetical protein